ncbi:Uncharacterized protein HZ326_26282 [Fusarium oxysporum f. sp. albedinis]|nr:Phosphate-repressible phosphate permease pho-4 [Fusarium oxysporum f. sp. albedinis]KAJ0130622.1 Uncharacterized protein HZ326_26282 [Fusarium oxysporum f. sp. albedinis]
MGFSNTHLHLNGKVTGFWIYTLIWYLGHQGIIEFGSANTAWKAVSLLTVGGNGTPSRHYQLDLQLCRLCLWRLSTPS